MAPALQSRIQAAFARVLESAEVREKLATPAIRPVGGRPEGFPAYGKREMEKRGGIIRARNIKPDRGAGFLTVLLSYLPGPGGASGGGFLSRRTAFGR